MARWEEFDYVVINDELDLAVTDLEAILAGEGASQTTQNTGIRARITDITGL
jgi:guanylate kinase